MSRLINSKAYPAERFAKGATVESIQLDDLYTFSTFKSENDETEPLFIVRDIVLPIIPGPAK